MADDDFSQDPIDELTRKFRTFWESVKQDYYTGTKPVERLAVLTGLLTAVLTLGCSSWGPSPVPSTGFSSWRHGANWLLCKTSWSQRTVPG
jgi:hypothetical protein